MDLLALILMIITLLTGTGMPGMTGTGMFPTAEPVATPTPAFAPVGRPTATPEAGSTTWIAVGVPAGKTASVALEAQAGDTILLQYEVAEHDVRAYLSLPPEDDGGSRQRTGLCEDEGGATGAGTAPQWHQVQECRTSRGSGTVEAAQTGEYRLEFDNSYSYFQPKMIRYRFHLEE